RDRARTRFVGNLNGNAAAVHDEHRRALFAGANQRFAGSENVASSCFGKLPQFIGGQRREDIYRRQSICNLILDGNRTNWNTLFEVKSSRRKCEGQSVATQRIPNSLPDERICVVVFRVVIQPIFDFPIDGRVSQASDANDGFDLVCYVIGVAYCFANNVNSLGWRVGVDGAEGNQPSIQVIARRNFNRLLRGCAVGNEYDVILERANFDRAPGNFFDHASMFLLADHDDVADLKRPIGVQRNSRKEISQRVLQRQTDNHAENCGSGEERPELNIWIFQLEDNYEQNRKGHQGNDVPQQRRYFVAAPDANHKLKFYLIKSANPEIGQQRPQDQLGNFQEIVL